VAQAPIDVSNLALLDHQGAAQRVLASLRVAPRQARRSRRRGTRFPRQCREPFGVGPPALCGQQNYSRPRGRSTQRVERSSPAHPPVTDSFEISVSAISSDIESEGLPPSSTNANPMLSFIQAKTARCLQALTSWPTYSPTPQSRRCCSTIPLASPLMLLISAKGATRPSNSTSTSATFILIRGLGTQSTTFRGGKFLRTEPHPPLVFCEPLADRTVHTLIWPPRGPHRSLLGPPPCTAACSPPCDSAAQCQDDAAPQPTSVSLLLRLQPQDDPRGRRRTTARTPSRAGS
jgi:hypothetical protein